LPSPATLAPTASVAAKAVRFPRRVSATGLCNRSNSATTSAVSRARAGTRVSTIKGWLPSRWISSRTDCVAQRSSGLGCTGTKTAADIFNEGRRSGPMLGGVSTSTRSLIRDNRSSSAPTRQPVAAAYARGWARRPSPDCRWRYQRPRLP
jgi:hypothetical protein